MKKGMVALVGAGPGEVSLLTLRAKELIQQAEVVVYDRLVSADILALIPTTAERVNVGKKSSHHLVPQQQINEILLELGQAGKRVVRLKGGDPFVFGRGGEEIDLLVEHGIQFEVVPGITSAIAAPSFGGIPVTHRDFCSSFHVITGHQKQNEPLRIAFDSLVGTGGTLIFLMGVTALPEITKGLLAAGMRGDMPAAMVENGTRNNQRRVVATLDTLVEVATAHQIHSPSIIIVGEVCTLATTFDWFSTRPLFGKSVLVPSATSTGGELVRLLKQEGAEVHALQTTQITALEKSAEMQDLLADWNYQWVVFTSKNGVDFFFEQLEKLGKDTRVLGGMQVAAVGPGTAKQLKQYGIVADYLPNTYNSTHLAQGLQQRVQAGQRVLFVRAQKGSEAILTAMTEQNISFTDFPLYQTTMVTKHQETLQQLAQSPLTVAFTSASTVTGLMENQVDVTKLFGVCIGEQTAKEAAKYGIQYVVSDKATLDSLVEKIKEVLQ